MYRVSVKTLNKTAYVVYKNTIEDVNQYVKQLHEEAQEAPNKQFTSITIYSHEWNKIYKRVEATVATMPKLWIDTRRYALATQKQLDEIKQVPLATVYYDGQLEDTSTKIKYLSFKLEYNDVYGDIVTQYLVLQN